MSTLPGIAYVGDGDRAEQPVVLLPHGVLENGGRVGYPRPRVLDVGDQRLAGPPAVRSAGELGADLGTEHAAEDSARRVAVVDEVDQVAEHDQRVGAVARPGERVGGAVHVGHHVHSHADQTTYGGGSPGSRPASSRCLHANAMALAARWRLLASAAARRGGAGWGRPSGPGGSARR